MNTKQVLTVVVAIFAVGAYAQQCGLTPAGCPNSGSATNLNLALGPFLPLGSGPCGNPPYTMQSANLYNMTTTFTATQTGNVTVNTLEVYSLSTSGTKIPNVITYTSISTNLFLPGFNITLTTTIGPPGTGVWLNTTYYARLFDLNNNTIWCVSGDVIGVLLPIG